MAGRPRTPTQTLKDKGSLAKNPDRAREREDEPEAEELGDPPKYLSKKEKDIWAELVAKHPPGVLTKMDEFTVETAVALIAEMREKRTAFNKHNQLLAALGRLGMTPTDRSKVHQDKSKVAPRGFGALRRGGAVGAQAN